LLAPEPPPLSGAGPDPVGLLVLSWLRPGAAGATVVCWVGAGPAVRPSGAGSRCAARVEVCDVVDDLGVACTVVVVWVVMREASCCSWVVLVRKETAPAARW
jgi:hypothetical protein